MPARRHLLAWAAILLAVVCAWALAGYWAAPRLLRSLAVDRVHETLRRELSLGAIHIDPFRLSITVDDLRLPDADGSTLLGWHQAHVEVGLWRSLVLRAPVLTVVRVEGLQLHASLRADGTLNLAELARLKGPDDGDTSPARYLVQQLDVAGESIRFSQLIRPQPFTLHLDRLKVDATQFGTLGKPANDLHLVAHTDAGERLEARGHLQVAPLRADANLTLQALQTDTLARYLGDLLPIDVKGGTLALDGQVDVAVDDGPLQLKARLAKLEVRDVGLRPRGTREDLIRIRGITATQGQVDLSRHEASLARVAIAGVSAKAVRDASGRLNLAAFAPAATPAATPSSAPGPTWHWTLPELALTGGEISLEDRGVKPAARLAVHDAALTLRGLSQDLAQPLATELSLRLDDAGRVASRGQFRADTLAYQGRVEASSIDLRPTQPYVQQGADLTLLSGKLGFTLDVDASTARTRLHGEADLRDLRTVDNALKQDFVQWKRLRARKIDFDTSPRPSLHVREIVADSPYARVVVGADRSLNLSHVLRREDPDAANTDDESRPAESPTPSAEEAAPIAAAAPPAMNIVIDIVRINNASANFSDLWIQPHFAVGIQDLGGTIKGLSSQEGTRATLDLKGAVDRYAPVTITGEINPLSAALFSNVSMSFRNMDLTSVTPYSGHFAGYEIRKGKLSVDLEYHIQSRKLDAKHHLVVDQLELGDHVESPDATSLPVRLAVALLKDRHGVIDVQLPVSGNLDDPKFRIGPLVWRMVVNLVVKIVTAPFALLGNLFGGGEEVNQVSFIPGTAQLDDLGRQHVEALRKAMVERPGLRLDLPAAWSAEIDRPAMLRRQLEAQLAAVAPQSGPDRLKQLLAAWREEAGQAAPPGNTVPQLEAALLERYVVDDSELEDLGRRRATAIQDLLFETQEIDPVRIFVVDGKPAAADAQSLRIDLLLK